MTKLIFKIPIAAIIFCLAGCLDNGNQTANNEVTTNQEQDHSPHSPEQDSPTTILEQDKIVKTAPAIPLSVYSDTDTVRPNDIIPNDQTAEQANIAITPDDVVLGNRNAKVVLVEYFSPTCVHCNTYHKHSFPIIKKKYIDNNKIAYVIREFITNKQDLEATLLARCKGDNSSYLKFMDIMLKQQESWAYSRNYSETLTNIGIIGAVSPAEYAQCLKDDHKIKILQKNTDIIMKVPGFIGTPSFYINGKQFTDPYRAEELEQALDAELSKLN
jgi:protein-disulfide isomerase